MGVGGPGGGGVTRPAIFLDRDGVLNRAVVREGRPYPPAVVEELEILPGVAESLAELKAFGYLLLVVTNQPDVARGTTSREAVEAIHRRMREILPLDGIFTCFHDSGDGCSCRKPKPGLLLEAARAFSVDMTASFMVGDRWRDVEAGRNAGCRTFFVDLGYDERQPLSFDYRVGSLPEAVGIILRPKAG